MVRKHTGNQEHLKSLFPQMTDHVYNEHCSDIWDEKITLERIRKILHTGIIY